MEGGSSEEEQKQKKSSRNKNRTGASSRSKDKQLIGMATEPVPKKSRTRYDDYEKGSSKNSKMKVDHNSSSENKNLVDIIGEINEKTQQKKMQKRQINDSSTRSPSGVLPPSQYSASSKHGSSRRTE